MAFGSRTMAFFTKTRYGRFLVGFDVFSVDEPALTVLALEKQTVGFQHRFGFIHDPLENVVLPEFHHEVGDVHQRAALLGTADEIIGEQQLEFFLRRGAECIHPVVEEIPRLLWGEPNDLVPDGFVPPRAAAKKSSFR